MSLWRMIREARDGFVGLSCGRTVMGHSRGDGAVPRRTQETPAAKKVKMHEKVIANTAYDDYYNDFVCRSKLLP